ncbi:DMT family transporter [Caenispirillum bisanense]|uniref:EamA-like transporter family protein n=1 Tax=Caenispirillum bisanense TaxID=414052 RepID=A0A286G9P0_9PROT|nr:DMT family transporter [Caenispirillum bisanense]SOD91704.1 EamA-like transporter family protein [Caenispirillum bisanense]
MSSLSKSSAATPEGAHAGMLLWALIVGLSFPAVTLLSDGLPPLLLTAIRFAIAAAAMAVVIRGARDRWPGGRGLALYGVMGLCLAGFFGAMFWAAHQVTALSMATLYVSVPLLAYGLGRLFGVERRNGGLVASLLLGAGGALALAWVGAGGAAGGLDFGLAEGLFFLGCGASALYPVLSKWGLERGWLSDSAALRTFWSLAVGGVLIGLLGLAVEPVQALSRITAADLLLVAYLGVFSSGVTFWLMQRGAAVLTPGTVTAYTYLVPFLSMLILFATDPATIGWQWLPGSAAVVLAIASLLRRPRGRPALTPTP